MFALILLLTCDFSTNVLLKYAISLCHMSAVVPDASNAKVVHLETTLGEVEYVIAFENAKSASEFKKSVAEQAAKGETEEVRKVREF